MRGRGLSRGRRESETLEENPGFLFTWEIHKFFPNFHILIFHDKFFELFLLSYTESVEARKREKGKCPYFL